METLLNYVWPIFQWLGQRSRSQVVWVGVVLALLVGLLQYRTGDELSVSILFVIPVALCSWGGGRWTGGLMAVVSTLIWMASQRFNLRVYDDPYVPFVNAAVLLASFMFAVLLIAALKDSEGRLEETVERRTAALRAEVLERQRAQDLLGGVNAELTKSRDELAKALANLQKTHEELKSAQLKTIDSAKMESVGRLAAGVAHEVKNPLMVISMGADYLMLAGVAGQDEAASGALQDIKDAVKRASSVIGGLLDYASTRKLETGPQDLNSLIENAIGLVKHVLTKNHVILVRDLAESLPPLVLDKNKIEQVFVNILFNAIQAMPSGGLLTVRTYLGQLETSAMRAGTSGKLILAEIEDTGSGIQPENLSKIFDPFFTTKSPGEGTGLGLSVVKQIIKLHKGAITIANRLGGGVRVTIFFRVNQAVL